VLARRASPQAQAWHDSHFTGHLGCAVLGFAQQVGHAD
jgi:hypothetical protein